MSFKAMARAFLIKPNAEGQYSISGGRLHIRGVVNDLDVAPDVYNAVMSDGGLVINYRKAG